MFQRAYQAAAIAIAFAELSACGTSAFRSDAASADDCTAPHAFDLGRRGAPYQHGCGSDAEPALRSAYHDGHALYVTEVEIGRLEATLARRSERIAEVQLELRHTLDALVAPDGTTTDRLWIMERAKRLGEEQSRLQQEVATLGSTLDAKRRDEATLRDRKSVV